MALKFIRYQENNENVHENDFQHSQDVYFGSENEIIHVWKKQNCDYKCNDLFKSKRSLRKQVK